MPSTLVSFITWLLERPRRSDAASLPAPEPGPEIDPSGLSGFDLLAWAATELDKTILDMLRAAAAERNETVFRSEMSHVPRRKRRAGMWTQSWKMVRSAAISFQVTLGVEDDDPRTVVLRMTAYPRLWLPPLEDAKVMNLVRRYSAHELGEALRELRSGETSMGYGFRAQRSRFAPAV